MKQIKFRAWDKINEEMIPWGRLLDGYNLRNVFMRPEMCGLILMQYTGLKDKNGVDIYEGDVLFHPLQGRRKVFYPYSETVASYGLRNIDNGFGSTLQDSHAVWEVIGNVYQNKDLLEEEK